jgi:hypothetical protein
MRGVRITLLLAVAVLSFTVFLPSAYSVAANKKREEISKEKKAEDKREDERDIEIVEHEVAAEAEGEEHFDQEQVERLQTEEAGMPAGEGLAPEAKFFGMRQSIASGGTHIKAKVNPHGTLTRVWVSLDWAKKCNTQVNCPNAGKYTHENQFLGSYTKHAKTFKGKYPVGECQVGEYIIVAINQYGATRTTGWFGVCYATPPA